MAENWIQNLKKGGLHQQLNIPKDEKIPSTLVTKIVNAPVGSTITNPTKVGASEYKVTNLLHERAVAAETLKKLRK